MKYCPNCGAQMNDADVFCSACGKNSAQTTQPVQSQPVNTNTGSFVNEAPVSPKSRLCHLILLITLGGFGVNDFYIGKGGKGALKLIFTIFYFIAYVMGLALLAEYEEEAAAVFFFVAVAFIIPVGIINLVEFITTLTGSITDGDNRPIKNWVND